MQTIKVSDAPKDTEVRAVFFLLGDGEQQIAEDAIVTNGTGYMGFSLNPPPSGWPKSRYKVVFFLNGKQDKELFFSVEDSSEKAEAPVAAGGREEPTVDQAAGPPYKTFRDPKFGFSFELPHSWQFQVNPNSGDYVFFGPEGTEESEITIIVQIIDPRKGEMADLQTQMVDLVNQIEKVPEAEIVKKDQVTISGTTAPFFLATYPAQNRKVETVEFGHTQLGVEHAPYLLIISYAAPRDIYQQKVDLFQHMIDTTQLFQPES